MEGDEFDAELQGLQSDEATASEMQHAIEHEISVRYDEDPVQCESLQERVEELIEKYNQKRLNDREIIEELREVLADMRTRDQQAKAKGLEDATELSFYHALEEVLLTEDHDTDQQELVELTGDIIDGVEDVADVVEWQEKVTVQQKLRKRVKLRLMKADIQMSG